MLGKVHCDSAVMKVFTRFLETEGWFVCVARTSSMKPLIELGGGDLASAKAIYQSADLGRLRDTHSGAHHWGQLWPYAGPGSDVRDVLHFSMPFDMMDRLEGTIITSKMGFRASNFEHETDLLEFLRYEVSSHVMADAARRNVQLLSRLAAAFSKTFVVTDAEGTFLEASGDSQSRIAQLLGVDPSDLSALAARIREEIAQYESAYGFESDHAHERPCILRLTEAEDLDQLGGPFYAILEPKAHRFPDAKDLRRRFNLTPSESNVVLHLVEGLTVEEIAAATALSPATIRTYLKRCFAKAGVKGQPQLIVKLTKMLEMPLLG